MRRPLNYMRSELAIGGFAQRYALRYLKARPDLSLHSQRRSHFRRWLRRLLIFLSQELMWGEVL